MEISQLLVDDNAAEWEFEDSDEEDDYEVNQPGNGEEELLTEFDEEEAPSLSETTLDQPKLTGNTYVDDLIRESGLHIVREREVNLAYKERGELGLFSLFFTREYRDALLSWTNTMLKDKGKKDTTVFELDAFIGLEIAMSIIPLTEIKELWSQKLFLGQSDFAKTMARNRFESIRARFQVHAPGSVPVQVRELDPLWHSRRLMAQIQQKFAAIAVPVGAVSLDENTVRTKARSGARTYMPSKPDKYGVRFYAVVGWQSLYTYSVWDNGSGNRTRTVAAERYVDVFPALRSPLFRTLERDDIPMQRKDASALWVAIIGLQGKWVAPELEAAKERMDNAARGSWELVAAIDVPTDWEKKQEAHKRAQKKLPEQLRTTYSPPMTIANNGWLCEEVLHRRRFQVPAIIVAYNLFMNGVDRVDQLRSTNPIRRKEKRLSMSILTWAIDLALINAFSLFKKVAGSAATRVTLREFKRRVAEKLTAVQRSRMDKERRHQPATDQPLHEVVGADSSLHALTPNSKQHSTGKLTCYLCSLRGFSKKALFSCTGCHRGFHMPCFAAFHYRDALSSSCPNARSALDAVCAAASGDPLAQTRLKKNKTITYLDQLELP
ncbi:hypothetical protein PHMEG_00023377 [Phytophthora megakarya]|uniref:PiggyBac transposable element-derived protein domain-containing protein n=1 Tax=Phytophthora megakarya TaxID=4795 RepID=A0A225VIA4_9STRA|nr:hypothetical protein PHMEG_00023377 [Phytophthora megakarya]